MKERINTIVILLISIAIYIGCEKKDNQDDIYNNDNSVDNKTDEEIISKKVINLKEKIENYDEGLVLLFQEEGNYTNSGNKEILAFYQEKKTLTIGGYSRHGVDIVYCFICNELKQTILEKIELDYGSGQIFLKTDPDSMTMDTLGRKILWLGKTFGYIGDFNNNGKDELYFFESSSLGTYPRFYEYDGNDFKRIFTFDNYYSLDFDNIDLVADKENRTLTFKNKKGVRPINVSYMWDPDENFYVGEHDTWFEEWM